MYRDNNRHYCFYNCAGSTMQPKFVNSMLEKLEDCFLFLRDIVKEHREGLNSCAGCCCKANHVGYQSVQNGQSKLIGEECQQKQKLQKKSKQQQLKLQQQQSKQSKDPKLKQSPKQRQSQDSPIDPSPQQQFNPLPQHLSNLKPAQSNSNIFEIKLKNRANPPKPQKPHTPRKQTKATRCKQLRKIRREYIKKLQLKKPKNPYISFLTEKKRQLMSKNSGMKLSEITISIAKQWHGLDQQAKRPYNLEFERNQKEYWRRREEIENTVNFERLYELRRAKQGASSQAAEQQKQQIGEDYEEDHGEDHGEESVDSLQSQSEDEASVGNSRNSWQQNLNNKH